LCLIATLAAAGVPEAVASAQPAPSGPRLPQPYRGQPKKPPEKILDLWDDASSFGKSGADPERPDPDESTGKSGVSPGPQSFWIPPVPPFEDVDPEELWDYQKSRLPKSWRGRDKSPYALLQLYQALSFRGVWLPKGYYLVKAGDWNDGSARLKADWRTTVPVQVSSAAGAWPPAPQTKQQRWYQHAPMLGPQNYQTLILKQYGRVMAVFPVSRIQAYQGHSAKEKRPSMPVAWLETAGPKKMLHYFERGFVYSCVL
jgi:hypothetical protein